MLCYVKSDASAYGGILHLHSFVSLQKHRQLQRFVKLCYVQSTMQNSHEVLQVNYDETHNG